MTTQTTKNYLPMCPFCPLFVEEDEYQPIGNDPFGELASIGGIPSCGDCASIIPSSNAQAHIRELARQHSGLQLVELCRCGIQTEKKSMCPNLTTWTFNGLAMCYFHLKAMADMNSDNEEAVSEALQEPDLAVGTRVHILSKFRDGTYRAGVITAHLPSRTHQWHVAVDGLDTIAYSAHELAPIA